MDEQHQKLAEIYPFLSSRNRRHTTDQIAKDRKFVWLAIHPDLANQGDVGQFDVLQRHEPVSEGSGKSFTSCEPTYLYKHLGTNSDQRHLFIPYFVDYT